MKLTVIVAIFFFLAGVILGLAVYNAYICPDTSKAIVRQIKEDASSLKKAQKEIKVSHDRREKVKATIANITPDECLDKPLPDAVIDSLQYAFDAARPTPD